MNKEEILNAFLQAEQYYTKPYYKWWDTFKRYPKFNSDYGLCHLFKHHLNKNHYKIKILESYWIKYRTTPIYATYHFKTREERMIAIKNVIKNLTNKN